MTDSFVSPPLVHTESKKLPPLWPRILLLAVLIFITYYPVIFSRGLVLDDVDIICAQALGTWGNLADIWFHPSKAILQDYMPLNYTTNWIEFQFWGVHPSGYHFLNLALHFANSALVFLLLHRMQVRGPFLVALLFALHPMQASSVAWIAQRKNLLYFFFYVLAFFAWIRFEEKKTLQRYLVVFLLFAAAMLSKRMAITWPLIALLFSWWRTEQPQFRNACRLIPFLLFALPLSFIVNMTQASKITPDYQEVLNLSLLQKILLAGNNIVFYIGKLLWPLKHVPFYPRWQINPTHLALYLAPTAIFITLVVLWMLRKRIGRGPFAALMFYLIGLSTILGFVPWSLMTITYTQDHYQYLACIGPFLLFSYAFDTCMLRFVPQPRWVICQTLMFLLLLPLAFIAHKHACLYNDEETLFAENYRIYPTMSDVTLNYGEGLLKNGKLQEALEMMNKTIALRPNEPLAWQTKGSILLQLGRNEEAASVYKQALSLDAKQVDTEFLNGYVVSLIHIPGSNLAPVIPLLERALAAEPSNFRIEGSLAIALSLTGNQSQARQHFEQVIRRYPNAAAPDVLYYYGRLRLEEGEPQAALAFLRLARERSPRPLPEYQAAIDQAESALKKTEK